MGFISGIAKGLGLSGDSSGIDRSTRFAKGQARKNLADYEAYGQEARDILAPGVAVEGEYLPAVKAGATLPGFAENLSFINTSPAFQDIIQMGQDRSADYARSMGLGRSGRGAEMSQNALYDLLMNIEQQQYGRQSNLLDYGAQSRNNLLNILGGVTQGRTGVRSDLAGIVSAGEAAKAQMSAGGLQNLFNLGGQLGAAVLGK
jgi:hypothetical protein